MSLPAHHSSDLPDKTDLLISAMQRLAEALEGARDREILPELLSVKQAAKMLNRKPGCIYVLMEQGELPNIIQGDGPRGTAYVVKQGVMDYIKRKQTPVYRKRER